MAEEQDPQTVENPTQDQADELASLYDGEDSPPAATQDEPAAPAAEPKSDDQPKVPDSWNRKLEEYGYQQQNTRQELRELREGLGKLSGMIESLAKKPAATPQQQEEKNDARELLTELSQLHDDDAVEGRQLKSVANRMVKLLEQAEKSASSKPSDDADLRAEIEAIKADRESESVFNAQYPSQKGKFHEFSDKGWQKANEILGENAPYEQRQAAATFAMHAIAKAQHAKAQLGKGKPTTNGNVTPPPSKKPGTSTTGAKPIAGSVPPPKPATESFDDLQSEMAKMWSNAEDG